MRDILNNAFASEGFSLTVGKHREVPVLLLLTPASLPLLWEAPKDRQPSEAEYPPAHSLAWKALPL